MMYTPTAKDASRIIGGTAKKNSQTTGLILDVQWTRRCCADCKRVDFPKKGTKKAAISGNGKYDQTKPK